MANLFVRIYPPSLAHLFVVKKMSLRFASLHFLSLQKMCLRLLSFIDVSTSLLLPLENILRCARTCLLRKNASIFIVVNCALTSIYQLCCAPQELAYFFIKKDIEIFIFLLTFYEPCGIIIVGNGMGLQASLKNSELRVLGA